MLPFPISWGTPPTFRLCVLVLGHKEPFQKVRHTRRENRSHVPWARGKAWFGEGVE